jgi:hypothetical protein
MEPQTYLSGEHVEPMTVPDFRQVFENYERFDVGAVGEFDVAVLVDEYAGAQVSNRMYPHWRGGYYYAVRSKADPAAPLGLLYASRWSSPEKASSFAAIYASALGKRYLHVHDVVQEAGIKTDPSDHLTGKRAWLTEDGPVVIDVRGDTVVITESLDQTTTDSLEAEVFGAVAAAAK